MKLLGQGINACVKKIVRGKSENKELVWKAKIMLHISYIKNPNLMVEKIRYDRVKSLKLQSHK